MEERYIIISGTNRRDSNTRRVAHQYQDTLTERNITSEIVTLEGMDLSAHTPEFEVMQKQKLLPAKKIFSLRRNIMEAFPGS